MRSLYTLFRNGGWSMFAVVIFGLVALATAAFYAARPDAKHEGFVKWMSRATLWSNPRRHVLRFRHRLPGRVRDRRWEPRSRILLEGSAESLSPGIMGFVLLSLTALLTSVGRRRLDARKT